MKFFENSGHKLSQFIRVCISDSLSGVMLSIFAISCSSLTFHGELASYKSIGIGLALLGAILLSLSYVCFSSYKGSVAVLQVEPAIILGVLGNSVAITL